MAELHLYNTRKVGGPSITLPIVGRNEVVIPAEGDPETDGDELIAGAEGVVVEADRDRLAKQAGSIRGLLIE